MFLIKIYRFLMGYIIVNVQGDFVERLINLLAINKLTIWDLIQGSDRAVFKIYKKDVKRFNRIIAKTKIEITSSREFGLPKTALLHKKRYGFYFGFLFFAAFFCYLSTMIWEINIELPSTIEKQIIEEALTNNGIYSGVYKAKLDIGAIKTQILIDVDEISYISINIKGTVADVVVKERIKKPEIIDDKEPTNIIADYDAQIAEIIAYSGKPVAVPGDVVKKGDLIVSGMLDSQVAGVRLLRSLGHVKGIVAKKYEQRCDFILQERMPTGEIKKRYKLKIFNKDIKLFAIGRILYTDYDKIEKIRKLTFLKDYVFPVEIITEFYCEYETMPRQLSKDQAILSARAEVERTHNMDSRGEFITDKEIISEDETGITLVKEIVELRDIGVEVPIELG